MPRCPYGPAVKHSLVIVAAAASVSFVALAGLVGIGQLSGLDQWSVDHLVPGLVATSANTTLLHSLFPLFDPSKEHGHVVVSALTYGIVLIASVLPAALLVLLAAIHLSRNNKTHLALGLGCAFVIINVVEAGSKRLITRSDLHSHSGATTHVVPFDTSFPSGHEMRATLLIICLIAVKPRLWLLGVAWLAAVSAMLVVGGWHTLSDVVGGLLVAVAAGAALFAVLAVRPANSSESASCADGSGAGAGAFAER